MDCRCLWFVRIAQIKEKRSSFRYSLSSQNTQQVQIYHTKRAQARCQCALAFDAVPLKAIAINRRACFVHRSVPHSVGATLALSATSGKAFNAANLQPPLEFCEPATSLGLRIVSWFLSTSLVPHRLCTPKNHATHLCSSFSLLVTRAGAFTPTQVTSAKR